MSFKKEELIVIALASCIFLGFIFLVKPTTTGFVIYTLSNYIYNSSAINLSNDEIKLIPITTTTSTTTQSIVYLSAATQYNDDKLSKVNSLDNVNLEIKENEEDEILDLTFLSNLENNDVISVYLTHNKDTNIQLCPNSNLCPNPYTNINYNGNQGYRNFTLNLSSPRNTFGIFPSSEKIKIDYIYATKFTTTTNTTITYPSQASIETQDIQPTNIYKFDYINYTETLNNQTIQYKYSTNYGISWSDINNKNISSLNITKIKLKLTLNSDTINTPIISNLSLIYTEILQTNTQPQDPFPIILPSIFYTNSSLNASSLIIDQNGDKITVEIVFWNNTKIHFRTNITNVLNNTYSSYILINNATNNFIANENWTASFKVFDGNVSSNWVNISILVLSLNNQDNFTSNNSNTYERILIIPDNVSLKIYSDSNISNSSINLLESNLTKSDKYKVKAIEIISENINFNSALLRINYTSNEVINLNESSIKAYYFNETTNLWYEINSVVNTEENYIEFNLTHFSVYGVFGDQITSSTASNNNGASSTNSIINRAPSSRVQEKKDNKLEIQIPKKQEPKEIKLFAESNKEESNKQTTPELITSQVVKEVKPINYLGLYLFVILIIVCYILYHFHVKIPLLNLEKPSSFKIKKLKK